MWSIRAEKAPNGACLCPDAFSRWKFSAGVSQSRAHRCCCCCVCRKRCSNQPIRRRRRLGGGASAHLSVILQYKEVMTNRIWTITTVRIWMHFFGSFSVNIYIFKMFKKHKSTPWSVASQYTSINTEQVFMWLIKSLFNNVHDKRFNKDSFI